MGPKINGLPSDCHPVLGRFSGRGCASSETQDVGQMASFFFRNHRFSETRNLCEQITNRQFPICFGIPPEIMSQHVGIQRHRISKNSSTEVTEVTLYNMLIDLCCLIPTYLIRTSTLKTNKAEQQASIIHRAAVIPPLSRRNRTPIAQGIWGIHTPE